MNRSRIPPPPPPPPPLPPPPLKKAPVLSHLHFLTGSLAGQSVPLLQGIRLGRGRDCHVILSDISMSRHHADLVPSAKGWVVRDLGSSNGTLVNGIRIQGEVLLRGDEALLFGDVSARLSAG